MEIIIEIGTSEQKTLIEEELRAIELAIKEIRPFVALDQIIIPADFKAKINELEGINTYESVRGLGNNQLNVLGRIVKLTDGYAIVLSPNLYTNYYDSQVRMCILLHELHHLINKNNFPPRKNMYSASDQYLNNLYFLYDEYTSDLFAYKVTDNYFSTKSSYWEMYLEDDARGLVEVATDLKYYNHIQEEIELFRSHADVNLHLKNIWRYCDEMAISLIHTFALAHCFPDRISNKELVKSHFVNDKTFSLMGYFNRKAAQNVIDLSDGINEIASFFENFGLRFEDRETGMYCHVLDI